MTMKLIDTHAHLNEDAFTNDLEETLARATDAGVEHILVIGTTLKDSEIAVELGQRFEMIKAVVGIQPNYVAVVEKDDFTKIEQLAQESCVVGIGETGLDQYWDYAPLDLQREYFDRHVALSQNMSLPFVVHCRDAETEVLDELQTYAQRGVLQGVMHSYTGSQAGAKTAVELGLHVSFAGMVTFKKNDDLREVAKSVPVERLLVETDSPYLAPMPYRGKRNEPAYVQYTLQCIADVREVSAEDLASRTSANARELFSL